MRTGPLARRASRGPMRAHRERKSGDHDDRQCFHDIMGEIRESSNATQAIWRKPFWVRTGRHLRIAPGRGGGAHTPDIGPMRTGPFAKRASRWPMRAHRERNPPIQGAIVMCGHANLCQTSVPQASACAFRTNYRIVWNTVGAKLTRSGGDAKEKGSCPGYTRWHNKKLNVVMGRLVRTWLSYDN